MNLPLKFARTRSARSAFLAAATAAVATVAVLATSPVWAAPASPVAGAPGSPPQRAEFLNGVSCPTNSFCMAVGYFEGLDFSPLSQIWNGGTWRTKAAPSRLPEGTLAAVSCPSSTSCLAVGRDFHTGVPIFDGWNGRTWRTLPPPTTPTVANLTSIACTGPASCIAVGTGRTAFSADGALAEQWNGTSWTRLATADPNGSSSSKFEGISCPSATSCMATGQWEAGWTTCRH